MFKAWQKYQTWDPKQNDKFQGYAILAVRGQVLMSVRRQNWFEHSDMVSETSFEPLDGSVSVLEQLSATEKTPESEILEGEAKVRLADGIAALPPDEREIIRLVFFGGLTKHAAIKAIGCSKREGAERYERALAAIKGAVAPPVSGKSLKPAARIESAAERGPLRPPVPLAGTVNRPIDQTIEASFEHGVQSLVQKRGDSEENIETEPLETEVVQRLTANGWALPPEQQELIRLIFFWGLSRSDAIQVVGCGPREGNERYKRAIAALKGALEAPAISDDEQSHDEVPPTPDSLPPVSGDSLILPIALVHENSEHLRTEFDEVAIEGLAQSIRIYGVLQPLIVRLVGGQFVLVAGKRRLLAAQVAGLESVPVIVQDASQALALELSLVENVQRVDLKPMELALAYGRLNAELGWSFDEIARRTGKDRASIMSAVRLLRLPEPVRKLMSENRLSLGHARALLGIPNEGRQIDLAEQAVALGLSVRQFEVLLQTSAPGEATSKDSIQTPGIWTLTHYLERALETHVRIVEQTSETGRIEIDYRSSGDLGRLAGVLLGDLGRLARVLLGSPEPDAYSIGIKPNHEFSGHIPAS